MVSFRVLLFLELNFHLIRFRKKSLLNVAKMGMLQSCQLLELLGPGGCDVADLSGCACDGAGNEVLVCVD